MILDRDKKSNECKEFQDRLLRNGIPLEDKCEWESGS